MSSRKSDSATRERVFSSAEATLRRDTTREKSDPPGRPLAGSFVGFAGRASPPDPANLLHRMARSPSSRTDRPLLQLQRWHGNRYVQRVVALAQRSAGEGEVDKAVESDIQAARGGGNSLGQEVMGRMESAFGADFSGVRVHTGSRADQLNRSLNARAFTTGQDIFFRQGEFDPASRGGQELLAHELTHVQQQGGGLVQAKLVVGEADSPLEREADAVARAVVQSEAIQNKSEQTTPAEPHVYREMMDEEEGQPI